MAKKRGRPLSHPSGDPELDRQRELNRRRVARHRAQRATARAQAIREAAEAQTQAQARTPPPSAAQLAQSELVAPRPLGGLDEAAEPTPLDLGLRVQSIHLPQDREVIYL